MLSSMLLATTSSYEKGPNNFKRFSIWLVGGVNFVN